MKTVYALVEKGNLYYSIVGDWDEQDKSLDMIEILYNGEVNVIGAVLESLENECYWELWNNNVVRLDKGDGTC